MTLNGIIIFFCFLLVVSSFLLFFPKLKSLFLKMFKSKKKSKKKNSKKQGKLKPSGAVSQIRPTLKPANDEKEKEDLKLLEAEKENKKLGYEKTPSLDFKYSTNLNPSFSNNVRTNSINLNNMQRTPEEIKKDFNDIKNFLDIPNTKNNNLKSQVEPFSIPNPRITNQRDLSSIPNPRITNQHDLSSIPNSRIDPNVFNDEESSYVDYRNNNSGRKGFVPQTNQYVPMGVQNNQMKTNNKYSKPQLYEDVNLNSSKFNYKDGKEDSIVKYDDVDIDLNKLSPKLKRLIIANILKRKNFD